MIKTFLTLALAVCAGSACKNQLPQPGEQDLRAVSARYDAALIAGDSAALDSIYLPEFTYVGSDGEVRTKAKQLSLFASGAIDLLEGESHDMTIRPIGEAMLAVGGFRGKVRVGTNEFSVRERYSALWVLSEGRWRLSHEHGSVLLEPAAR